MTFSHISWSRPGSRILLPSSSPQGKAGGGGESLAELVCWGTLLDTQSVLGQPELVGPRESFSQEHIAVHISALGLGV